MKWSLKNFLVNALTRIGYMHGENYAYLYSLQGQERIWQECLQISEECRSRLDLSTLITYDEMSPDEMRRFCCIGFSWMATMEQVEWINRLDSTRKGGKHDDP